MRLHPPIPRLSLSLSLHGHYATRLMANHSLSLSLSRTLKSLYHNFSLSLFSADSILFVVCVCCVRRKCYRLCVKNNEKEYWSAITAININIVYLCFTQVSPSIPLPLSPSLFPLSLCVFSLFLGYSRNIPRSESLVHTMCVCVCVCVYAPPRPKEGPVSAHVPPCAP